MTLVAARGGHRNRSRGAGLPVAFGTAQAAYDIFESRIPTRKGGERMRMAATDVAADTAQIDQVLAELVVEFVDGEIAHDDTVHPSSYAIQ